MRKDLSGTPAAFEADLAALLNKHSVDAVTNTPDFILAEFLVRQLQAYSLAAAKNVEWHGWNTKVGGS